MDIIERFLEIYPDGFEDIRYLEMAWKHDDSKIVEFFQNLSPGQFDEANPHALAETIGKIVSKSTMVSTFEKISFRNYLRFFEGHGTFIMALKHVMENYNQQNFDTLFDVLCRYKDQGNTNAAKWPVMSFFTYYGVKSHECYPVKPTTVKQVAQLLKVDIDYKARPNFETYEKINNMYRDFRQQTPLLQKYEPIKTHALLYIVANN